MLAKLTSYRSQPAFFFLVLSYKELMEQKDALNAQLQKLHSQMAAQVQLVLGLFPFFCSLEL